MDKFIVAIINVAVLTLPGLFFLTLLPSRTRFLRDGLLLVPFLSVSFLVVLIWVTPYVRSVFPQALLASYGLSAVGIVARRRKLAWARPRRIPWAMILAGVVYFSPYLVRNFPAGNDASMHGYVTRLLIDAGGIPETYRPLFPAAFGSYSSGFSALAAASSGFNREWLHLGSLFGACSAYFLCYLGLALLLRRFLAKGVADTVALVALLVSRVPQNSFAWGGNPTALAFALSLALAAMVMIALQQSDRKLSILSSLVLAAIPLVHAVPAATLAYLAVLGGVLLIVEYRRVAGYWLATAALTALLTLLFVAPYLQRVETIDVEVLGKIRDWQVQMGPNFGGGVLANYIATWEAIKYRLGDAFFIVSVVGAIALFLVRPPWKRVVYPALFIGLLSGLIMNSGYWVIPGSFLLYPERAVFYMIVPLAYYIGLVGSWGAARLAGYSQRWRITGTVALAVLVLGLGFAKSYDYYLKNGLRREYTKNHLAAFAWINANLPGQAVFRSQYDGHGVWLPAMTGRPTSGIHLHLIHARYVDWILARPDPYLFITNYDREKSTPLLAEIDGRDLIYENDQVWIYR